MESSDFLFVVAEIAVAFAAFAGLVTVVGQRLSTGTSRAQAEVHQLRTLLVTSLLTAFAALFPYVVYSSGVGIEESWRIASAVYAASWAGSVSYAFVQIRALLSRSASPGSWSLLPWSYWSNQVLHVLVVCALAGGAVGAWGSGVEFTYLAALLTCLYVCASLLVSLFVSLARSHAV